MEKKMQKITFREFLAQCVREKKPVALDGGMGTMIQAAQAEAKEQGIDISYSIPEELNITHGDVIKKIYRAYLEAGANVLTANTFGANPIKVASESEFSCKSLIEEGVKLLKNTIDEFISSKEKSFDDSHQVYIGWDTGQIGKLLEPMGELTFDEAYNSYKEAAIIAENAGAEVAIVETMSDLYEVKAAVLAIKENTHLPIIASMTFQSNLRTLTGADVLTCVTYLEALGVDVLGFNCGGDLAEDEELARQFCAYAHIPVLAQPNAGLPVVEKGRSVFKVLPSTFAASQAENRKNGVCVLGGCCGTTPLHIKAMIDAVKTVNIEEKSSTKEADTYICSYNQTVQVGGKAGPMIIGERINPTGKKKCKAALLAGDMQFVINEAESQINAGAQILDVNVGLPGIDEAETMKNAVKAIQSTFATPLQLDSSEPAVLEKALRYYNGKALVNSVNGKKEMMDKVFPLVAKYGGSIVALCIDEAGIAPTAQGRVAVADKMIAEAAKYGIKIRDIFIDTLTLTVSSEQKAALETLKAIEILKAKYGNQGLRFVLGVSNISFGLPRRDIVNSRFLSMALYSGLSACIINPLSEAMMDSYNSYRALAGFDENCLSYIEKYSATTAPAQSASAIEAKTIEAVNSSLVNAAKTLQVAYSLLNKGAKTTDFAQFLQTNEATTTDSAQFTEKNGVKTPFPDNSLRASDAKTSDFGQFTEKNSSKTPFPSDSSGVNSSKTPFSVNFSGKTDRNEQNLIEIIEKGFKEQASSVTKSLLTTKTPVEIIDGCIVPALDKVGKDFEKGKKFLPQLLLSADTVAKSFAEIKSHLASQGTAEESKGSIVIATVFGDIHDIGKNIVKAMLENYGYTVIDLGKNVPAETVVETVIEKNIELVGLSALMTTTVANMEKTIKLLREELGKRGRTCKIMAGGAVLTEDYALKIGADYYAKDAMASVNIAKEVFKK